MNGYASLPLVGLTMGDVAGIGPEVIARGWLDPRLHALARPVVIGDPGVLRRAAGLVADVRRLEIQVVNTPEEASPTSGTIPCLPVRGDFGDLDDVRPGAVDRRAGRAAYAFLNSAIDLALAGRIDAITTLPLNKQALHRGRSRHPGHTEILAERCNVPDHAMMLYLENRRDAGPGLGVVHVTLHVALRRVFDLLSRDAILSKIRLADQAMRPMTGGRRPADRGDIAQPACRGRWALRRRGEDADPARGRRGPSRGARRDRSYPNDTLFYHALGGEYDAVVAMYHDQGHIALKTVGFHRAVNVTLGLPIVRTSVAHGTAFDIAWKGLADPSSLIAAVRVAARIVAGRHSVTSG